MIKLCTVRRTLYTLTVIRSSYVNLSLTLRLSKIILTSSYKERKTLKSP